MKIPAPNFTQTPNELFDEWLSILSHVELKVLMVIMRKTFGWHKIRDRISLTQLEKITGSKRSAIIKAAKNLQKLGLIFKEVVGEKGLENTVYELVIIEDSNNFNQSPGGTPPSLPAGPTKENVPKYEKKNSKKKNSNDPSPVISFNRQTLQFEGITETDIRDWRKAHPSVNVLKVLDEAKNWAKSNPRDHYRISLNTFMKNTEMKHTTPWNPPEEKEKNFPPEDVQINKNLAEEWELIYNKNRIQNYDLQSKPSRVLFLFPNNESHEVSYLCSNEEFIKDCKPFILRLKIGEKK